MEYFALSDKETRIAKAALERPVPTIEQIRHVLESMPANTDVDLRNRTVVALTLLTGARDGAIASLKLKHIDIVEGKVVQDAREVRTKFSKNITTWFFPVGDDIRQIVVDWIGYLIKEKLFGPADPLFPATQVVQDQDYQFQAGGLSRQHWANATPIRMIFSELIAAGRHGQPDFLALLHGRHVPTCVYCFDLLELNGRDLREQPLVQRRARLQALLARAKSDLLRFSDSFPDANALLAECSRRGLEGIVCKWKDSPYRSGLRSGWVKVKTSEWRVANRYRAKLFEKPGG